MLDFQNLRTFMDTTKDNEGNLPLNIEKIKIMISLLANDVKGLWNAGGRVLKTLYDVYISQQEEK